jgi:hypothetical protein
MEGSPRSLSRPLTLTERVLFERLGWFVEVRWLAGFLALVFMAVGWYVFHVRFEVFSAVIVVFAMFFYNAFFSLTARALYQSEQASKEWIRALAHAQVVGDLLAVAALVHYIGGVENHFVVLFVFPVIVASEFFSKRTAYGYATLAAVLVNLIGWGEYAYRSAHYPLRVLVSSEPPQYDPLVAPGALRLRASGVLRDHLRGVRDGLCGVEHRRPPADPRGTLGGGPRGPPGPGTRQVELHA